MCRLEGASSKVQRERRNAGYRWLSKQLNLPLEMMQFGRLSEKHLNDAIALCDANVLQEDANG